MTSLRHSRLGLPSPVVSAYPFDMPQIWQLYFDDPSNHDSSVHMHVSVIDRFDGFMRVTYCVLAAAECMLVDNWVILKMATS